MDEKSILDRFIMTMDKIQRDGDVPVLWKINTKDAENLCKTLGVDVETLGEKYELLGIKCDLTSLRSYCICENETHSVLY